MKLWTNILILLILSKCLTAQTNTFYDPDNITTIRLNFENQGWDSVLSEYYSEGYKKRLEADLEVNSDILDSVGVRFKGYSSYKRNSPKKPLNIELNYLNEQRYYSFKTFKLSNGYRDPSLLREVLAYEIARKYMPASMANFAEVYINNEYTGLYTNVQAVDDYFLLKHFENNNGVFFKGAPAVGKGGMFQVGKADFTFRGDDSTEYMDSYELKSDRGWEELIGLFKALSDPNADIDEFMNVDRVLWVLAFHNVLVSLDSPINAPRNFYLYKNNTGLFELIPWDFNMAFGTYLMLAGSRGSVEYHDLVALDPFHNINNDEYPLMKKFLNIPEYRRMYLAHMKTIIRENFSNGWYKTRAAKMQDLISDAVFRDDNKFYTMDEFWENIESNLTGSSSVLPGIFDLMDARVKFLLDSTDLKFEQPVISDVVTAPGSVLPNSEITVTANISLAENVYLYYRNAGHEVFEKIEMYDNGEGGDMESGDGLFSAKINAGTGQFQYYIYAEHEWLGIFSPERAAHEYYNLGIAGDLVINEFLASNDTSNADEFGEFDDWIELYNNSDNDIPLLGYYLSDKVDNLQKWEFPDTTIEAGGYLIVWADEDSSQGLLHANFKLSAGGEDIFLLDSEGTIVDHINYGGQITDISYGRFPNGLGPFITMLPTVTVENDNSLSEAEHEDEVIPEEYNLSQNYPNPFNPVTTIEFSVPPYKGLGVEGFSKDVQLIVYDMLGRQVEILINEQKYPGNYNIKFNASHLSSGVYFYVLRTDDFYQAKKMLLIK